MSDAPLYAALMALAEGNGLRFHLPGHKGKGMGNLLDGAMRIDYTEIPPTGNLYGEDGIIQQAEGLAARHFGAGSCFFLTCGATQGIKAALAAFCGAGEAVVLDRNCHGSALDACVLLDLHPTWVWPAFGSEAGLSGDIAPQALREALRQSGARAALVTSPTYYGHLLDIEALAAAARSAGAVLLVDAAHGSHLRACGLPDAMAQGADAAVFSAHKTLTAFGQGALLLTKEGGKGFAQRVRGLTALFGTTSPSYPIMASLDLARARLEEQPEAWPATVRHCAAVAARLTDAGFRVLSPRAGTDPARLTLDTAWRGIPGHDAARHLRQHGIEVEMADARHIVCIVTPADSEGDLSALASSLEALPAGAPLPLGLLEPPRLSAAMTPRQARFSPSETMPLARSAGRIAACSLSPYPPGVPVVACGESIDEKAIEYLLQKGYNGVDKVHIVV